MNQTDSQPDLAQKLIFVTLLALMGAAGGALLGLAGEHGSAHGAVVGAVTGAVGCALLSLIHVLSRS